MDKKILEHIISRGKHMARDNTLTNNTIEFIKYQCDRYADASNKAMEVANKEADRYDWTYEQKIQHAAELIDDFLGERP